jgi:TolB-like protein/class 3 adenylate cyclase
MAVDVVSYSRLMGRDESATLTRLREHRKQRFEPVLARYGGRLVKLTGDGALVEFASAVDALGAAIEFQQAMVEANREQPEDTAIVFRIGLHLGDLIVEGDDLYGDGVNIAARLEAEAPPGGIIVSRAVREAVDGRTKAKLLALGELALKNIERPIRAFRVEWEAADWQTAAAPPAQQPEAAARPAPALALALPDKPSIAVLPFQNLSGDPDQEYFADGMVEEIITALSRIRWLFVIARHSSFTYKGQTVDVKQVGRELGVRYVLEGSVRKGGNRVRITAQLIDATNGTHLWADRFDGLIEDVFEIQDKVAISVAGVLEPTLRQTEIGRAGRKRPDSLDAYDHYLRALPHAFTAMPEDADTALSLLGKAVELEPDFAAAHAIIAWCHEQRYLRGGMQEETQNAALRHARQAIAAGSDDAAALATAGFVIAAAGRDYDTALTAFDRSFALSSSSALALGFSSVVRAWKGHDAIAVEQANRAIRLSPFDPLIYLPYIGLAYAHFAAGRFEEAVAAASLASQSNPRFSVPQILHAAALGGLDRKEDAKKVVQRLLELQPGITVATAILSARYINPQNVDALENALRRAGLPVG